MVGGSFNRLDFAAGGKIMPDNSNIDEMVQEILSDMSLKEKAAIANLDEEKVTYLQYAFDICVRNRLGSTDETGKDIMHRILEVLQATHRVRCVNKKGAGPEQDLPKGGGKMIQHHLTTVPC